MSNKHNLGLAFYSDYYKDWDFEKEQPKPALPDVYYPERSDNEKEKAKMVESYFVKKNKSLKEQQIDNTLFSYPAQILNNSFSLTTIYPGLLIGSGYTHGIGQQGEHKIGFYFDYTTGLPIIPGSSVKGTLRSVFPGKYLEQAEQLKKKNKMEEAELCKEQADARTSYILYLLEDVVDMNKEELNEALVGSLEKETFEGVYGNDDQGRALHIPMNQRDIFHDAILNGPEGEVFIGNDFITPHKNTKSDGVPDALKNPIPIQFLKVLPGIKFLFQFRLLESFFTSNIEGNQLLERPRILTAGQRQKLFEAILKDVGIGAKTNVGYGQFASAQDAFPGLDETLRTKEQEIPDFDKGQEVEGVLRDKQFQGGNRFELLFEIEGNPGLAVATVGEKEFDKRQRREEHPLIIRSLNDDGSIKFVKILKSKK